MSTLMLKFVAEIFSVIRPKNVSIREVISFAIDFYFALPSNKVHNNNNGNNNINNNNINNKSEMCNIFYIADNNTL